MATPPALFTGTFRLLLPPRREGRRARRAFTHLFTSDNLRPSLSEDAEAKDKIKAQFTVLPLSRFRNRPTVWCAETADCPFKATAKKDPRRGGGIVPRVLISRPLHNSFESLCQTSVQLLYVRASRGEGSRDVSGSCSGHTECAGGLVKPS